MGEAAKYVEQYGMNRSELRELLHRIQDGLCSICDDPLPKQYIKNSAYVNIDHKKSRAHGGLDVVDNLGLAHLDCNFEKGENCTPGTDCKICFPTLLPGLD